MPIEITEIDGTSLAEIVSEQMEITSAQDALDIMANCAYQGARKIIVYEKNIVPDFFNLETGIAGEVLQKFSTYDVQLAIVGDFGKYTSKSLRDFMYESNKVGRINFVASVQEAQEALLKR